jgi:hypothetical protein
MVLTALLALSTPHAYAGINDTLPGLPPEVVLAMEPVAPFLEIASSSSPTLPADPIAALIDSLRSLATEMGVPKDPTPAVLEAALDPEAAGFIALVLADMLKCQRITKGHMNAISPEVLKEASKEYGKGLNPATFADIRRCAQTLWVSTSHLQKFLTKAPPAVGTDLDFWPVLRVSRSKTNNTYSNDYALLIDAGGNDTYDNNAGASLIDVNWGPPGQPGVLGVGRALGCRRAIPGITTENQCIPAVGVLLDLGGDDTYGVKHAPELPAPGLPDPSVAPVDSNCTSDPVVGRLMTIGAGFLGVGVLVDKGGDDVYTAKTGAIGTGHVGGVGIFHDLAGNDSYSEVRNGTGFGLVAGLGVFRDHAGDDVHDFYMPSPKSPTGTDPRFGIGGVIDDEDVCDNKPRFDVGGGNVGAVGVAVDDAGNDTYLGGFTTEFQAPLGSNAGGGGSQGFANNGATGLLLDRAGIDSYSVVTLSDVDGLWVRTPHPNSRANGVTLVPSIDPATQQGGETGTGGFFKDF